MNGKAGQHPSIWISFVPCTCMRLSPATVERIRNAADIADVVGDFVTLKRRGKDMIACCPFHDEKTPSFHVNAAQGYFKCFGCGKGGDSITFIMEIEKATYTEALRRLANKFHITIEEDSTPVTDEEVQAYSERESLFIAMNWAKNFFRETLQKSAEGRSLGLSYLRERGFNEKTAETFELGFSPEGWDGLLKSGVKAGHTPEMLEKAGLVTRNAEKVYDRFRGRVMFPIHNVQGKVIAFGARMLGTDKSQPKYLNSPETDLYKKSEVLYGIYQAKSEIRHLDNCYLCEGYTDVISLHQAGIKNVVASSGTSLTENQIKQLGRFSKNITVLYDGDAAGIKASLRGIDMILEAGLNVRAVTFPGGHDPDSYLKEAGTVAFAAYLKEKSQSFIVFKAGLFADEIKADPYRKAEVIKDLVTSISKIPEPITRLVFFKQCADLLDVPEDMLIAEANKIILTKKRRPGEQQANQANVNPDQDPENDPYYAGPRSAAEFMDDISLVTERDHEQRKPEFLASEGLAVQERACLSILINYAAAPMEKDYLIADYYVAELQDLVFSIPVLEQMMSILREALTAGRPVNPELFLQHPDTAVQQEAMSLLIEKYTPSEGWEKKNIRIPKQEDRLKDAAYTNVLGLKWRFLRKRWAEVHKVLEPLKDAPAEEAFDHLILQMQLKQAEQQVAKLLGNVLV